MGSYSSSSSVTQYTNTPLTLDNNENGVALAGNRDTLLGGFENIAGSTNSGNRSEVNTLTVNGGYSALDGGAIERAFNFGDSVVTVLANLTKQQNEQAQAAATGDIDFNNTGQKDTVTAAADKAQELTTKATDFIKQNIVLVGVALVGFYWFKVKK
jgi:hypothetical protein